MIKLSNEGTSFGRVLFKFELRDGREVGDSVLSPWSEPADVDLQMASDH
jgi:hypothetical protein